jgi:hypothetical protein
MMKKSLMTLACVLVAGILGLAVAADKNAPAEKEKPRVFDTASVTMQGTVEKIDYKTRIITLKASDGTIAKMEVGPEAVRFKEIKKGDVIKVEYLESVAVVVQAKDKTIASTEGSGTVVVRNQGKKPSGMKVETEVVTATVEKIDAKKRIATLKGPEGNTITINISPDVKNLENVKKGDQVIIKYTRTIAIDVQKP